MPLRRKSLSCPPTLNGVQFLQDPLTLTAEQLQKISKNDAEEMERIEKYKAGGYMPVCLKQEVGPNKDYQIIRKLGFGAYSTVWLTEDKSKKGKYYALKIMASSTSGKAAALREIDVLKRIKLTDPTDVGCSRLLLFHTYFFEKSAHGKHICVMNEAMGKSLLDLLNQSNCQGLDQQGVKSITRQVVEGLKYLHVKCHVIHADIKIENIVVSVKDSYFDNMAAYVRQFDKNGIPMPKSYISTLEWVNRNDSAEESDSSETASSLGSIMFYDDYSFVKASKQIQRPLLFVDPDIQIKIVDFGCAFFEGKPYPGKTHPASNRALEIIIGAPCSFPIDMWSVGCVAYELSTGDCLFDSNPSKNVGAEEWQLYAFWKLNNGIPKHVASSGKKSSIFFDSAGNLKRAPKELLKYQKLQHKLVTTYGWKLEDALLFEDFILSLVNPDPTLRATACTVLNKAWLEEM